jgi:hypothetical protein
MRLPRESLQEFFRDQMAEAQKRQKLALHEMTQFYVVNLLAEFLHTERLHPPTATGTPGDEPIALQYCRALQAPGYSEQFELFKSIGDRTLFVSGFFGDSLKRKIVDVGYYIAMGERAYEEVSALSRDKRWGKADFSGTFEELSEKFSRLVDVLAEISEKASLTSDSDLLRLYERWLATKSVILLEKLREKGILPVDTKTEPIH